MSKFDQEVTLTIRVFDENDPDKTLAIISSSLHVNFDNRKDIPTILKERYERMTKVSDQTAAENV